VSLGYRRDGGEDAAEGEVSDGGKGVTGPEPIGFIDHFATGRTDVGHTSSL